MNIVKGIIKKVNNKICLMLGKTFISFLEKNYIKPSIYIPKVDEKANCWLDNKTLNFRSILQGVTYEPKIKEGAAVFLNNQNNFVLFQDDKVAMGINGINLMKILLDLTEALSKHSSIYGVGADPTTSVTFKKAVLEFKNIFDVETNKVASINGSTDENGGNNDSGDSGGGTAGNLLDGDGLKQLLLDIVGLIESIKVIGQASLSPPLAPQAAVVKEKIKLKFKV